MMTKNATGGDGDSLASVVGNAGLPDVVEELGEKLLDSLLDDGVVKEIPIVRFIVASYKTGVGVRDHLFARKITEFLANLNAVPFERREAFRHRMEEDPKQRKRVGESLVLILDRLDDTEKPVLVARAFEAFIEEQLDFTDLKRAAAIVDRTQVADLRLLRELSMDEMLPAHIALSLSSCGLLEIEMPPIERAHPVGQATWTMTEFGDRVLPILIRREDLAGDG